MLRRAVQIGITVSFQCMVVCLIVCLSICVCLCRVDELYAFFIQWSLNIEADEEGFVVVNERISAHTSEPSLNEPHLLRSASISKDWEVTCIDHS